MQDGGSDHHQLGVFLRTRRERARPSDFGITSATSRRTPGLRREEVAFMANIGAKWYASVEAGDETHPSPKTLSAIANALRLSRMDRDYVFHLAGLSAPVDRTIDYSFVIPPLMHKLLCAIHGVGAAIWDLFLTPLAWNSISEGFFGSSAFASPLERNLLVQGFGESPFLRDLLGRDFDRLARNAVGMFRRYYTTGEPSDFARQVYDCVKGSELFQQYWDEYEVTDELAESETVIRDHPKLGTVKVHPFDLHLHNRDDIVLKLWFPADQRTAEIFRELESKGGIEAAPLTG